MLIMYKIFMILICKFQMLPINVYPTINLENLLCFLLKRKENQRKVIEWNSSVHMRTQGVQWKEKKEKLYPFTLISFIPSKKFFFIFVLSLNHKLL